MAKPFRTNPSGLPAVLLALSVGTVQFPTVRPVSAAPEGVLASPATSPPLPVRLFAEGEFERAWAAFSAEAERQQEVVWPRIGMIRSLLRLDRWPQALKEAEAAVRQFPLSGDLAGLYALTLIRAGRLEEAAKVAETARDQEPFSFFAQLAVGQTALWKSQAPLAREAFDRALEIRPDDPDAWLGRYDATDSRTAAAEEEHALRRYLSLKPRGYPHSLRMPYLETMVASRREQRLLFGATPPFAALSPVTEAELRRRERTGQSFEVRLPFVIEENCLFIRASIDGVVFRLVFDTGGGSSILLFGDAARRLPPSVKKQGAALLHGVAGTETATRYKADRLTLGELALGPVAIEAIGPKEDMGDGILGASIFAHWAITLDFEKKQLVLRRGKDARAPLPNTGNYQIEQPFRWRSGKIFLPVRIGKEPVWGMLDTGASTDLLSLRLAEQLAATMPPDKIKRGKQSLVMGVGTAAPEISFCALQQDLTLQYGHTGANGALALSSSLGLSILDEQVSPVMNLEVSFLMGMPSLQQYQRVTFDYPRRLLTLEGRADRRSAELTEAGTR